MRSLDFESEVFPDLQRAKACQFERWVHSKHWNIQLSLLKLVKPTDRTSVINSSYSRWLESYKGTAGWITSRVSQTSRWKCVFDAHKLTWTAFRRGTDNFVSLSPFFWSLRERREQNGFPLRGFVIRKAFYIWHTFGKQLFWITFFCWKAASFWGKGKLCILLWYCSKFSVVSKYFPNVSWNFVTFQVLEPKTIVSRRTPNLPEAFEMQSGKKKNIYIYILQV